MAQFDSGSINVVSSFPMRTRTLTSKEPGLSQPGLSVVGPERPGSDLGDSYPKTTPNQHIRSSGRHLGNVLKTMVRRT